MGRNAQQHAGYDAGKSKPAEDKAWERPDVIIVGRGLPPTQTITNYPRNAYLTSACNEYVGRLARDNA